MIGNTILLGECVVRDGGGGEGGGACAVVGAVDIFGPNMTPLNIYKTENFERKQLHLVKTLNVLPEICKINSILSQTCMLFDSVIVEEKY